MRHPWVKPGEIVGWTERAPTWPAAGRVRTWLEGLQPGTAAEIYDLGSIVAVQTLSAPRKFEDGSQEIKVSGRSWSADAASWIPLSQVRPPDHRWPAFRPSVVPWCIRCSATPRVAGIAAVGCQIMGDRTRCRECGKQVDTVDYLRVDRAGRVVAP